MPAKQILKVIGVSHLGLEVDEAAHRDILAKEGKVYKGTDKRIARTSPDLKLIFERLKASASSGLCVGVEEPFTPKTERLLKNRSIFYWNAVHKIIENLGMKTRPLEATREIVLLKQFQLFMHWVYPVDLVLAESWNNVLRQYEAELTPEDRKPFNAMATALKRYAGGDYNKFLELYHGINVFRSKKMYERVSDSKVPMAFSVIGGVHADDFKHFSTLEPESPGIHIEHVGSSKNALSSVAGLQYRIAYYEKHKKFVEKLYKMAQAFSKKK